MITAYAHVHKDGATIAEGETITNGMTVYKITIQRDYKDAPYGTLLTPDEYEELAGEAAAWLADHVNKRHRQNIAKASLATERDAKLTAVREHKPEYRVGINGETFNPA